MKRTSLVTVHRRSLPHVLWTIMPIIPYYQSWIQLDTAKADTSYLPAFD